MILIVVLGLLVLLLGCYAFASRRHRDRNLEVPFEDMICCQRMEPASRLRFGFFPVGYNGCGCVAAYNAERVLGRTTHPARIIRELEAYGAILFGLFGTSLFALRHYFRRHGCRTKLIWRPSRFQEAAKAAPVSILWYAHKRGAHFVTFRPGTEGFLAYNVFSNRNRPYPVADLTAFAKKHGFFAVMMTIEQ